MNRFMEEAIKEANKAKLEEEVPIGAVIVKDGKIIAKAHNKREKTQNAIMHAELIAIDKACKKLKSWRLEDCHLYVTLEPCPMCAGAILNARISKIFYGAEDKTSCDHIFETIIQSQRLNHTCEFEKLEEYSKICASLLTDFFKTKRK
ncbi:MAG: nucleoside deaminase [Candidatus Caccovivens sp.]